MGWEARDGVQLPYPLWLGVFGRLPKVLTPFVGQSVG